ncbi:MAG: DUF2188 domain-containing protein [Rhodospirillaceae bacterium]|nr:DUF2188 domain-containing protein [Rhodospirillaceae bacterium]
MANQHVTRRPHGWAVKSAGAERATAIYPTQAQAIDHARQIAKSQESELLIHGRDGRIRHRDSHGQDPFPPKG